MLSCAHTVCMHSPDGTLKVHSTSKVGSGYHHYCHLLPGSSLALSCTHSEWARLSLAAVCHMLQGLLRSPDHQCREVSACSVTRKESPGERCAQLFPFLPSSPLKPQQSHL